jgi:hypothetical protein
LLAGAVLEHSLRRGLAPRDFTQRGPFSAEDIITTYTPFGNSDWQEIHQDDQGLRFAGKKIAMPRRTGTPSSRPRAKKLLEAVAVE